MDFSDNFHNIKNFVQVDHLEKKLIIPLIIPFYGSQKTADVQKNFPAGKNKHKYMPDSHVKISGKSDYNTLQNLSSNNIEKKESEMSRITKSF
jgi:hypothetical protein